MSLFKVKRRKIFNVRNIYIEIRNWFNISIEAGHFCRFKSSVSLSMNPEVGTVHYCHIKAYSRKLTTLNLSLTLLKTLFKPYYVSKTLIDASFFP